MPLLRKQRPGFELTGLVASPDGLYDGSFIAACAAWWNRQVEASKRMQGDDHRPFTPDEVEQLRAVVQPANRAVFEGVASMVSMPGRYSASVLSLAYAFAVIIEAGAGQLRDVAETHGSWRQARPFTKKDLVELRRHYNEEGAAHEYECWVPYWMAAPAAFSDRVGTKLIRSVRSTFDDQVDRWGVSEGVDHRKSIGAPDWSLISFDERAGLPNFVELLFEWGGRLRLGESFLADGEDLADHRFGHDEMNVIDHLYSEAYDRFVEMASQPNPVSTDVELAIRMCAEWLGGDLDERGRLALSTTAVRGYLWRLAEDRSLSFLEPELSQAVERSRSVGDHRSPDEPFGLTLYYAASQCMVDGVKTRLGSLGGLIQGPRSYEKAFFDTRHDFDELEFELDDSLKRLAFQFGVSVADSERVVGRTV